MSLRFFDECVYWKENTSVFIYSLYLLAQYEASIILLQIGPDLARMLLEIQR